MRSRVRNTNGRGALSIEFLLVISALMLIFLVMLQYAMNAHARRVAQAAAEDALQATQAYDGSAADGRHAGNQMLADLGNLTHPSVTVSRTATTAEVTITGNAQAVIPLLPTRITVHIQGPVERFVGGP
ncbi:MAG: TadE family protein [Nocardioides sp.]